MKIPELLEDLAIISQLGDNPGSDDGLSAEALKAKFDEAALKIQKYINTVLIPAVNPAVIPHDYFAPAGYGLGEPMQIISADSETDLYNKLDTILATLPDSTSKFIGISCYAVFGTGYTFNCELHNAFNGYATLRGVSYNGLQFFIYKDNGNWFVEWVNPPMLKGVEYRTTERYDGKPVYIKLCDLGALPNATTKTYDGLADYVDRVVDATLNNARDGGASYQNAPEISWYVGSWGTPYVSITTSTNMSDSTARITLKYTKTTD